MSSEAKAVSRSELYEQVWSRPMIEVCKDYGISNVGLGKLCRRHDIPCPYRGYWARKAAGQTPDRTPLPKRTDDRPIAIQPFQRMPPIAAELQDEVAEELDHAAPIPVRETLHGCHRLVSRMRQSMEGASTDENGLLESPSGAALAVRVSKASLHRSLRIFDALLGALDRGGHVIEAGPTVTILDITVGFSITENLEAVQEEPKEHDLSGPYSFGHSHFLTKRIPSGQLTLHIDNADRFWARGCRQAWRDGKRKRLEELLPDVVSGLVQFAARKKEDALERQRREQQMLEEEKRRQDLHQQRAALRAQILAEQANVDTLIEEAEDWSKSRLLRAYIEARTLKHSQSAETAAADPTFEKWREWATDQANRLDPLAGSPASILDKATPEVMKDEEPRYSWGR